MSTARANIDPKAWGQDGWALFHDVARRAPQRLAPHDRAKHDAFLGAFARSLPCGTCRSDFSRVVKQHPLTNARTRDDLLLLYHRMHAAVNRKLGKGTPPLSDMPTASPTSAWGFLAGAALGMSDPAPTKGEISDMHALLRAAGHRDVSVRENASKRDVVDALRRNAPPGVIDAHVLKMNQSGCCAPSAASLTTAATTSKTLTVDATMAEIMMGLSIAVPIVVAVFAAIAIALLLQRKNKTIKTIKAATTRRKASLRNETRFDPSSLMIHRKRSR